MHQRPHRPLRDQNILVVEDDPFIAMDLKGVLEGAGATVIGPAHDLCEAVSLVERFRICAAVLDYRLQVGNTLPLARTLARRGIREHPDAMVIPKPFRADQLVSAVQALLAGR
jgi:CheY-like chemotaxis protein